MSLFAEAGNGGAFLGIGFGMLVLCFLGWLLFVMAPTWIALFRGHPNWLSIAVINFFLAWTVIGWIVCLAWSFSSFDHEHNVVIVGRRRRRRDD